MLIDLFHYTAKEVALYIELLQPDLLTDDFLIADGKALRVRVMGRCRVW